MKDYIIIFLYGVLSISITTGCCSHTETLNDLQYKIEDLTFNYQLSEDKRYIDTIKALLSDHAEIFKSEEEFYDYYINKNLFVYYVYDTPHESAKFLDKVIDENKIPRDSLYMVVLMKNRFASMDALKRNDVESAEQFILQNLTITQPIVNQYEDLVPQFVDHPDNILIPSQSIGNEKDIKHKALSALYSYLSDLGRLDSSLQQSEINRIKDK